MSVANQAPAAVAGSRAATQSGWLAKNVGLLVAIEVLLLILVLPTPDSLTATMFCAAAVCRSERICAPRICHRQHRRGSCVWGWACPGITAALIPWRVQ
jgi:hypothetical protein